MPGERSGERWRGAPIQDHRGASCHAREVAEEGIVRHAPSRLPQEVVALVDCRLSAEVLDLLNGRIGHAAKLQQPQPPGLRPEPRPTGCVMRSVVTLPRSSSGTASQRTPSWE